MEATKGKNDKQAAEYIRRLVNEEIPEMKVEVNYSESKITESDGWSLLMVARWVRFPPGSIGEAKPQNRHCKGGGKVVGKSQLFRKFFVCQSCGMALCEESKFIGFDDNYCKNCGKEIASDRELALAEMLKKEN